MPDPKTQTRKMDIPLPVVAWLQTVKDELWEARGHRATWPDVWDWLMAQHKAADQGALSAEAQRVEAGILADRARRAGR